jgi:hypothetical protein
VYLSVHDPRNFLPGNLPYPVEQISLAIGVVVKDDQDIIASHSVFVKWLMRRIL